ncbi:sporulation integral membrane protein YtvI [Roseburia sp. 499]|uniref:sporulation integral membrane protein YtvI n=1 Tax=Roseburia sp. 499 TaxID=1261634 RepID=UPI0009522569|nr:sporulation integral membrane protein YtvI [Roseburia sp. 499]WVK68825.1 sporulation integral membrane protein YtvI [Roseburia sp. 499]
MKKSTKYLKILVNLLVALLVILLMCVAVPKLLVFFMPFVIGWIISMIANPLVHFLEKKLKVVRKHGSMITIIGVLAAVILVGYLAGAKLVSEAINLIDSVPQIYENFQEDFEEIGDNLQIFYDRLPKSMQKSISNATENLSGYISGAVQAIGEPTFEAAGNFAKNVPGTLIGIIMCIISAYFFTADRENILNLLEKSIPDGIWKRCSTVISDLKHVVGGYFKAQFKIMGVVYIILVIGLLILKVDYVLLVGLLIAFLDALPFFGTGTVLGPWAILKILSKDYTMAVGLIILYLVTQLVRQLIQPKMVGDSIGMNPLATLIFMYIGYKFSSIIGMIIAVPIGMILINLYKAGVFDNQIRCIKELVQDINEFRKLDEK